MYSSQNSKISDAKNCSGETSSGQVCGKDEGEGDIASLKSAETGEESSTQERENEVNDEDRVEAQEAKSLVCNDCGKRFKNAGLAELHASRTDHVNFSESTEEIAPLTEEQKREKLAQLQAKLLKKRAEQAETDKELSRKNEEIRRKSTKESQDLREELRKKELFKDIEARRREKKLDVEARRKVEARIEADKQERRRKAELEKQARANNVPVNAVISHVTACEGGKGLREKVALSKEDERVKLRLKVNTGEVLTESFAPTDTLEKVADAVFKVTNVQVSMFELTYPRRVFRATDEKGFQQTLSEAGLKHSAVMNVS